MESVEAQALPSGFRFGVRASGRGAMVVVERASDGSWRECGSLEIIGMFEFEGACRALGDRVREILRCERLQAEGEARLSGASPAAPPTP
jgi:hypothetical protein